MTRAAPPRPYASLLERVLANAEPIPLCGCWIWTGAVVVNRRGMLYGKMSIYSKRHRGKRARLAHRVVLADKLGVPLYRVNTARHTCDVSLCVNPAHLIGGTRSQNNRDQYRRGRR